MLVNKTGYCLKFGMYTGKSSTGDVEKCLWKKFRYEFIKTQNQTHVTTFLIASKYCKGQKIHAVGILNVNHRHMAKLKPDKTLKRDNIKSSTSDTGLLATKWKDKPCVQMVKIKFPSARRCKTN